MAIRIKCYAGEIKVGKYEGTVRYQMRPQLYSSLSKEKVIKEAALRSGVTQGVMQACWDAAGQVIKAWATEGHSVALPGLGTMRFGLRASSVANVNEVGSDLIKSRRIIFTPNSDLKQEVQNTPVQITCYDIDGNVINRVNSSSGTVETESDVDTSDDEGNAVQNTTSGSISVNSGSGSSNNDPDTVDE